MNYELFFSYYINQARLLDLFAILNGGFPEYEEVNSSASQENMRSGSTKAEASGSGFRIFKVGGSLEGQIGKVTQQLDSAMMRRVQTTTSTLSIVIETLIEKNYVHDISDARAGSFVIIPVRLKINSIRSLLREAAELVELGEKMTSLGSDNNKGGNAKSGNLKEIKAISSVVKELFNAEEIVFETDEYAVIGNISDDHLYQSSRSDIIDVDLSCLAQVRRLYDNGTQLMKNTVFAKMQDAASKIDLINSINQLTSGGNFEFESEAIPEIVGKPVYQLEIVALYQKTESEENGDDNNSLIAD
ncbi:MAG: hypothetical protein FWC99_03480 [Coriobacteriia bacterium]|nr:hypothetical protein [Coriobacteriia bacterium]